MDQYLTLTEAAKRIPATNGGHVSCQTLFRWTRTGCRGVRLKTLRFGRRIVTTPEALDNFARELSEVWNDTPKPPERPTRREPTKPKTRTPEEREKAAAAAEARLRARGVLQ